MKLIVVFRADVLCVPDSDLEQGSYYQRGSRLYFGTYDGIRSEAIPHGFTKCVSNLPMSLAYNKPPRHAAIGKRLALLLEKGSSSDRTLTTCVAAAGKAADRGLISIVEYRDTNWKITSDRVAAVSCYYRLTDSGEELRGELIKGGAAVAPAQNDRQLKWLLDQTCRSVYEDYGEPDEGFYCGDELNTLASSWVDTAIAKLELPTDHTGKFSVKPEKRCREPIIAESIMRAHNTGLTLCFYILPTFDLFKGPLYVVIELNVRTRRALILRASWMTTPKYWRIFVSTLHVKV